MPLHGWRRLLIRTLIAIPILFCLVIYYPKYIGHRHVIKPSIVAHNTMNRENSTGFLPLSQADRYCASYNWKIYPKRDVRRKVYDLFMVNTELDWLEIRLKTLHSQVDYFVIVEATHTFTGKDKPLHVSENWHKFEDFRSQIIHHILNDSLLQSSDAWDHEDLQRNAMFEQVFPGLEGPQKPNYGDVILVSDADEIPRPETISVLRNCNYPRRLTLRSRFYYYSFQWLHRGKEWEHPQATYFEGDRTIRPADLRNGRGGNILMYPFEKADLWNSAWHCSSCFATLEAMLNKISSFSHQEWNQPKFREKAAIVERIRNGLDLFDRKGQLYDKIENNQDIPEYVRHNPEKWGYLLDRDPVNANFEDYDVA